MRTLAGWLLLVLLATGTSARGGDFNYTADAAGLLGRGIVVDARAQAACLHRTVAGARCLPAADFLGPHGRLAAFADIYWLLGTAGIAADQPVLVVGDDPTERDFVAGMLYLCGQAQVTVLTRPISGGAGLPSSRLGPGTARGMLRHPIYQGVVRGNLILLRNELAAALGGKHPPVLLDGRPEAAYWGESIRAQRGGHLPGAQSMPMAKLREMVSQGKVLLPPGPFVAYGHDAFESAAYFTLARAGAGADARVLLNGWADWANQPALPVDAETYPDRAMTPPPASADNAVPRDKTKTGIAAAGFLALVTGGWYLRRTNNK